MNEISSKFLKPKLSFPSKINGTHLKCNLSEETNWIYSITYLAVSVPEIICAIFYFTFSKKEANADRTDVELTIAKTQLNI